MRRYPHRGFSLLAARRVRRPPAPDLLGGWSGRRRVGRVRAVVLAGPPSSRQVAQRQQGGASLGEAGVRDGPRLGQSALASRPAGTEASDNRAGSQVAWPVAVTFLPREWKRAA